MRTRNVDSLLLFILEDKKLYTLEALAQRVHASCTDVHRSFMRLCRIPGWSIRPYNRTAYWRAPPYSRSHPRYNRGRSKGEAYVHDPHEPDWNRTQYEVRRPVSREVPHGAE